MVTNLVALWRLNKSLCVYRVPHGSHARQEFTVMMFKKEMHSDVPASPQYETKHFSCRPISFRKRASVPLNYFQCRRLTMAYLTYYKKAFRNKLHHAIGKMSIKFCTFCIFFLLRNCGTFPSVEVRKHKWHH